MSYKSFQNLSSSTVSVNDHYKKIYDFGNKINDQVKSPFNSSNPLTYCLFPTLGSQFQHGSSTSNMLRSTYNPSCETYMAERCSVEWDGFCEAYKAINSDTYWPNVAVIDGQAYTLAQNFLKNNRPTVGEVLVRNSVNYRFLHFPYLEGSSVPFDPNVANSPMITLYPNSTTSPSLLKNLDNIETDPHITLMLQNTEACFDILARMYLALARQEPGSEKLRNSRVEKYLLDNQIQLNSFLEQTMDRIPSFQMTPSWYHTYSSCTSKQKII